MKFLISGSLTLFLISCSTLGIFNSKTSLNFSNLKNLQVGELTQQEAEKLLPPALEKKEYHGSKTLSFKRAEIWIYRDKYKNIISTLTFYDSILSDISYFPSSGEALQKEYNVRNEFKKYKLIEKENRHSGTDYFVNKKVLYSVPNGIAINFEQDQKRVSEIQWSIDLSKNSSALGLQQVTN